MNGEIKQICEYINDELIAKRDTHELLQSEITKVLFEQAQSNYNCLSYISEEIKDYLVKLPKEMY